MNKFTVKEDCIINDYFTNCNEAEKIRLEYCKKNCQYRCQKNSEYKTKELN